MSNSNKSYEKWFAKCSDVQWTESDVIYFRKAIGLSGLHHSELRVSLRNRFYHSMPINGYRLTREQQDKGTEYLLSKSLKKDGSRRKGCKLGTYELGILLSAKVQHSLVGLHDNSGPITHGNHYLPVYRAQANGRYFDYIGAVYDMVEVIGIGEVAA